MCGKLTDPLDEWQKLCNTFSHQADSAGHFILNLYFTKNKNNKKTTWWPWCNADTDQRAVQCQGEATLTQLSPTSSRSVQCRTAQPQCNATSSHLKNVKKCTQCSTCTLHPRVRVEDITTSFWWATHMLFTQAYFESGRASHPLPLSDTLPIVHLLYAYFLAKVIFMALDGVILKPCRASLAAPACMSVSNSTKAMSWRPGTRRTSLNPGNLRNTNGISWLYIYNFKKEKKDLLQQ